MERKTVKFEVKDIDEEEGTITGYGSTFDDVPDSYGDVVDKGAFSKSLKENSDTIVSLFNHDIMQPIGLPEAREDSKGLFTKIKIVRGVQKAEETLLLAKAGVLKRMSIGYDTVKQEVKSGVRHLKEVRLYDISPVVFAANPSAMILDVKAIENSLNNNQIEPIEDAVKALQALLEKYKGKEPSTDTLEPEDDQEAAELDVALKSIQSEIDGFDVKKANDNIDAAIIKLTEGN